MLVPRRPRRSPTPRVAKPGTYQLWSDIAHAPSPEHSAELYADGSVLLTAPGSSAPLSAEGNPADALLKGGSLLDAYGTSVVKPGVVPDQYHVFGGEAKTGAELQSVLDQLQAAYDRQAAHHARSFKRVPAGPRSG